LTLQVSNIAGDGETWRRHVTQDTQRRMPRLAGKGRQGTGRTAYGIRGYIRSMKRTKRRIQVDRGTQGRNTKAMNCCERTRRTQTSGRAGETESAEGTSRDSETHATVGHRRQECNGRQSLWREPPGIRIHMHTERSKFRRMERHRVRARTTPSSATHKGCHDTDRRKPGSGGHGAVCRSLTTRKEMDGHHETE
jgi:hypothetical protein